MPVDTQKGILIYGKGVAGNQYVITNLADGFQVWVADTLHNLVNSATAHQAEVLLFELRKGSREELRTFKALRLLLPEVKILVILDTKSTRAAAKVLKYGATDVFPKPFDPQLLVERVKALLQQG